MKESHYFFSRLFLATIFISLMKSQVSIIAKLVKLKQNQSINTFLNEDISHYNTTTQMIISQSMMR